MSTLIVDNPQFDYPAGVYPRPGRCHVRVFDQGAGEAVLLVTDLGDENPGASVTNTAEIIVTAAVRRYGLDPAHLTVVEHYDDRWTRDAGGERRRRTAPELARLAGRDEGESFDVVTFTHVPAARMVSAGAAGRAPSFGADADPLAGDEFGGPMWRRVTKHQAEALVGQALP
ncbi:hypothetical protein tb265_49330 [Gemmatimonadetes bacterium T265]|nr:hypothetical protein tb265_49330 [Gemmatimonadetes bacterium T265]